MTDKNTILAIVLSAIVLIAWQYFVGMPQQQARQQQQQAAASTRRRSRPAGARHRPTGARNAGRRATAARPERASHSGRGRQPRRGAEGLAARADHDRQHRRLDRAQGRPHRRRLAGEVPRDRRSQIAADRPAVALGQPRPVLRRVRLDRRRRRKSEAAGRRHAVDARGLGPPHRQPPGDARLRQWRRPHVPPHHCGRQQIPVHRQGRGHQQGRQAGLALSLRIDLAPRHAQDRRLLHPARGPGRLSRQRGPAGIHLQEDGRPQAERGGGEVGRLQRHRRLARHHRQILGGDAAAADRRQAERALFDRHDRQDADLPDRLPAARAHASRRAPAPPRPRGCSPAPRKPKSSTATRARSSSTTSIC